MSKEASQVREKKKQPQKGSGRSEGKEERRKAEGEKETVVWEES